MTSGTGVLVNEMRSCLGGQITVMRMITLSRVHGIRRLASCLTGLMHPGFLTMIRTGRASGELTVLDRGIIVKYWT